MSYSARAEAFGKYGLYNISKQFIWLIDRTLSGTATSDQSGLRSDDNKEVLCSPQITGASSSDRFVSWLGHSLGKSYTSAKMQSVYSAAPADWARLQLGIITVLIISFRLAWKCRLRGCAPSHGGKFGKPHSVGVWWAGRLIFLCSTSPSQSQ